MSLEARPRALAPWALQPLNLKGAVRTALSLCGWASLRKAGEEGDPWLGLDPTILVLGEPKGFLCVTPGMGTSEVCDPSPGLPLSHSVVPGHREGSAICIGFWAASLQ